MTAKKPQYCKLQANEERELDCISSSWIAMFVLPDKLSLCDGERNLL